MSAVSVPSAGADRPPDVPARTGPRWWPRDPGLVALAAVGVVAASSYLAFGAMVAGGFAWWLVPTALAWAALRVGIDHTIRAGVGARSRPRAALVLVSRLGLAGLVALLVGEALLLAACSAQVDRELTAVHQVRIHAERQRLRAAELAPLRGRRDQIERQIEVERPAVDDLRRRATAEAPSITPADQSLPRGVAYHLLVTEFTTRNTALQGAIAARAATDAEIVRVSALPLPAPSSAFVDAQACDDDLLARQEALRRVIDRHPSVEIWRWLLVAVVLVADVLPVLALTRPRPVAAAADVSAVEPVEESND